MHHHRDIQLGDQLEKRQGVVVVRVVAGDRGHDHDALEAVLGDGALQLFQHIIAAGWQRAGEGGQAVRIFILGFGEKLIVFADHRQLLRRLASP